MLSVNGKSLFRRCLSSAIGTSNSSSKFLSPPNVVAHLRAFSTFIPSGPLRSQPQYAVFGEKSMLVVKMMPPTLKALRNGALVIDQNKKGRIILEWAPRVGGGTLDLLTSLSLLLTAPLFSSINVSPKLSTWLFIH